MPSRLKLAIFLLVIGFCSLLLAVESVRIALASRIADSKNIAQIRRAVSWNPADPELHFQLGTAEVYDLEDSDSAEGIQQLRLATELSPHKARYWSGLASACEFEGDKTCAGHAVSRSLALSPMAPRIHWEAANYYLWANQQTQALSQFRRLLELDASYDGQVFARCLRATGSPDTMYHDVLPSSSGPALKLRYVDFLAGAGHEGFAFRVWKEIVASHAPFTFSDADPYLEHLISARKYQEALSVWDDLESRDIVQHSGGNSGLIFNGGFEHVPLNAGFDWRYHPNPYVAIDFRGDHPFQGKHCLRLDFSDVENHQDEPVYQLVPVKPDHAYVLTAEVRSYNLSSGSGPCLHVTDPYCRECLTVSSEAVVGTTAWHQVTLRFRTGPQTSAVRVSVWRARSLGYPTEILGTLWVDQVSLRAAAPLPVHISQKRGIS